MWWKKREYHAGDTDRDMVSGEVARWRKRHPGAKVQRGTEGKDGRGRMWYSASMRVKRASAESAARSGAVAVSLIKARQKTPRAAMAVKPRAKKPSRELGLGEQTMTMGDVKAPAQKLQQPAKPPRY